jgi:alpha-ketoglutarate-dependent taurine dioxygenase
MKKKRHAISLEDGSPIPAELFAEIKELEKKLVFRHSWKKNDLLILNNRRVMHGREKYEDLSERAIFVKMANWK